MQAEEWRRKLSDNLRYQDSAERLVAGAYAERDAALALVEEIKDDYRNLVAQLDDAVAKTSSVERASQSVKMEYHVAKANEHRVLAELRQSEQKMQAESRLNEQRILAETEATKTRLSSECKEMERRLKEELRRQTAECEQLRLELHSLTQNKSSMETLMAECVACAVG